MALVAQSEWHRKYIEFHLATAIVTQHATFEMWVWAATQMVVMVTAATAEVDDVCFCRLYVVIFLMTSYLYKKKSTSK